MMWLAQLALWLNKGWSRKPRKSGCLPAIYLLLLAASTITWIAVEAVF